MVRQTLDPKAGEDPWGQAFVEPLGLCAGAHRMYACMCLCICGCTHVHVGVYIYMVPILSMYMVHICICGSTQTHTSIHTKWFDKCLTPKAGEDPWGQAFVEPLGVFAVVPRRSYNYFNVHCVCIWDIHKHILAETPSDSTNA